MAFGGVLPLGVLYLPNTPVGLSVFGGRLRSVGQNSGHRRGVDRQNPTLLFPALLSLSRFSAFRQVGQRDSGNQDSPFAVSTTGHSSSQLVLQESLIGRLDWKLYIIASPSFMRHFVFDSVGFIGVTNALQ